MARGGTKSLKGKFKRIDDAVAGDKLTDPALLRLLALQNESIEQMQDENKAGAGAAATQTAKVLAPITDLLSRAATEEEQQAYGKDTITLLDALFKPMSKETREKMARGEKVGLQDNIFKGLAAEIAEAVKNTLSGSSTAPGGGGSSTAPGGGGSSTAPGGGGGSSSAGGPAAAGGSSSSAAGGPAAAGGSSSSAAGGPASTPLGEIMAKGVEAGLGINKLYSHESLSLDKHPVQNITPPGYQQYSIGQVPVILGDPTDPNDAHPHLYVYDHPSNSWEKGPQLSDGLLYLILAKHPDPSHFDDTAKDAYNNLLLKLETINPQIDLKNRSRYKQLQQLGIAAPSAAPSYNESQILTLMRSATQADLDTTRISLHRGPNDELIMGSAGNTVPVRVHDTSLEINGNNYPKSDGLINLLIYKNPRNYTSQDMRTYAAILKDTGLTRTSRGNRISISGKYGRLHHELSQNGAGINLMTHSRLQGNRFGKMMVDTTQLGQGILHVNDDQGRIALHTPVTPGLVYLMKNPAVRRGAGKFFTAQDLDTYHSVANMAGIKLDPTNRRRVLMKPEQRVHFLANDPKQLIERLDICLGELQAGNTNKTIKNEAMTIADILLRTRHITKAQHKAMFDEITSL